MPSENPPTLADDEATLQRYGQVLADAFESVAREWFARLIAVHDDRLVASVTAELDIVAAATADALRSLLIQDIADQAIGPLELLRRAVIGPTELLRAAEVAPVRRDEFAERNFPDDIYDLTPASFADVDPSLHEPGLMWGAAKAHVHLRRRRELPAQGLAESARGLAAEPDPAPMGAAAYGRSAHPAGDDGPTSGRVVVLAVDLMDRSKISAAYPEAVFVRSPAKLAEEAVTASLVLVDLARLGDSTVLRDIDARIIAYGSHVNDVELGAARAVGAEALPRSAFFRRLDHL